MLFVTRILFVCCVVLVLCATTHVDANITTAQLKAIMPNCKYPEYLQYINAAMKEGSINNCARKAAFLAQIAHESGEFVLIEETASRTRYEGRKDLGNNQTDDEKRFKGCGPIQLTGRPNYRTARNILGLDPENHPEKEKIHQIGFQFIVWSWTNNNLNPLADQKTLASFRSISRKMNGRTRGQADREKYWNKAKKALKC